MDYLLKKRLISTTSQILDTVSQQPVDLDFTLPDYCADIEKILKCSLTPKIFTRTFSGGQLRVDGASLVRIIYCDSDKKQVRICEQTLPFSATFPVSGEVGEHIILTQAKPEYLNCRALTPRRLTIHGAFSLHASIIGKKICDLYEDKASDNLQVKKEDKSVYELCELSQESFNVSEAISIHSKSNLETIVRSELSAVLTDVSVSGEKLTVKGEMTLRLLYICDAATGEVDRFVYVFPFTQTITGADPDCTVRDIRLSVLSYELLLRSEMMTEEPVVNLEAKLSLSLMGYKPQSISYICDAYSTKDFTDLTYEKETLCTNINAVTSSAVLKPVISLGEKPVSKILDIFTEECCVNAAISGSSLNFTGKVNVCILACTDEGELISIERQADIASEEILPDDFTDVSSPVCSVSSLSYRLGDNNDMELRLDLRLSAVVHSPCSVRQVIQVDCAGETQPSLSSPLTLYYAHSGEVLWDIAKRYNACVDTLCDENGVTEDILSQNRMLLILRA